MMISMDSVAGRIKKSNGSISVTVVSSDSSMVAMSGTIGSAFGSKLLTSSGIIMNNGMSSFSMPGLPAKAGIENSVSILI